jgi:hypothetical protein
MKSQKEGGFGPPRAVTPWKKKKQRKVGIRNILKCIHSIIFAAGIKLFSTL